jgi:toxin ParE1/3/4
MKRPVLWSPIAATDFIEHLDFLKKQSPKASRLVRERVLKAVVMLSPFQTGRPGRKPGTYELHVSKTSILIVYRFTEDGKVRILRAMHTARNFTSETKLLED